MGYLLVVSGVDLRYRQGVRYGDTVEVVCWIDRLRGRAIDFSYEVWNGDQLAVTGLTKHIWTQAKSHRACRLPEHLRDGFEAVAGSAPQATASGVSR